MQSWQDFLATQTLNPVLDTECALCDLSHLGLIEVQGEDKLTFLQGQLTNDIQQINPQTSQLNSYCNPKGRMLTSFRIFQRDDSLMLLLPLARLQATLKRLRMFVLRSKVTLEDVSQQYAVIEIAGECAATLLDDMPTADNSVSQRDSLSIIRIPGDRLRLQMIGDTESILAAWQQAAEHATPTNQNAWHLLDIRAGLPTVYAATSEAFVPQMANMQLVNGVNFSKGCYTGQEVVARMQYLGKLKRRMYRMHIAAAQMPQIGDDFHPKNTESKQSIGKIADIAPNPEGGYEALVIGQISNIEADDLQLATMPEAQIRRLNLPYAFE